MAFLAPFASSLLPAVFGVSGLLAKKALGGGKKKTPRPVLEPRPVRRDEERTAMEEADALRRRKGAAADLITGVRGAEAGGGSIGRLVMGS
jgi:hypothetical protein